jgi:Flp pilus assembly pilin Flp
MVLNPINNQRGAASVEYAFLVVLIAAVVAGTVATLGTSVLELFGRVVFW